MFSKKLFGERLHNVRTEHGETQLALAQALGVGKSQVSEMENGKKTTTAEKIAAICEHYQVSANYLLGLSDDPTLR